MDPAQPAVRELVLTGPPAELHLPDLCARCGVPAKRRLYWEKVFEVHDSESGYSHLVIPARAPFCAACIAQHEREVKRMSWVKRLIQCFRSEMIIPAILTGALSAWMLPKFIPKVGHADLLALAVFAGLLGFFGLVTLGCFRAAWLATRHHTVPPLTSITRSFEFTTDISDTFEGERHRYTLANDAFSDALLQANRERVWHPSGKKARAAAERRILLYAAIGICAAVAVLWEWIEPYMPWRQ